MRRSDPLPESLDRHHVERLGAIAGGYGITHTGVAAATVLVRARSELHRRRDAGLHDTMQFTYKNPDRSTDPCAAVPGALAVFVGARPYSVGGVQRQPEGLGDLVTGRVARYAQADHYAPLRAGLWAVAEQLRADGWKAVAFADDNSIVDREVAHQAGLGWFGKNANLLITGAGSWFVLGCVVTTAPLPIAAAVAADGCGSCRRCLDGCPTGAIVAPGVVDASRCLAWLLQKPGSFDRRFRRAVGDRLYGCDDCQEVCPPTVRLNVRSVSEPMPAPLDSAPIHSAPVDPVVDVLHLLQATDDEVLRRWGRWYLADRDPRWLRRNALVILGNSGRSTDPRVVAALVHALADVDPILRAHAVWAARMLGLSSLLPAGDPDPDVMTELGAPL